jgi:hypothetical protein
MYHAQQSIGSPAFCKRGPNIRQVPTVMFFYRIGTGVRSSHALTFAVPVPDRMSSAQKQYTSSEMPKMETEFIIDQKTGAKATMLLVDGSFLVKKGSTAVKGRDSDMTSYRKLKEKLVSGKQLVERGQFYVFAEDVIFKSPSAAAAIVLDRNANGRVEWKHRSTGATFAEWERGEALHPASES